MILRSFYKAGKLNVDADSLSRIPWEHSQVSDTPLDTILTKNTLLSPQLTEKIPHLPHAVIQRHELFVHSELELSKSQWKHEQDFDHAIRIFVQLLKSGNLASYQIQKTDHDDLKCMLRLRKEFFLDSDLLYRKNFFKSTNRSVSQFVIPRQFRKCTVLVCHEDYGH